MVEELAAIFAAYAMGIGLVHLVGWRYGWAQRPASRAVIVVRNTGATVEWHLRTFAHAQRLRARCTNVTLIDEGSEDETVRIAERFIAGWHANWELIRAATPAEAAKWLEAVGDAEEVHIYRGPLGAGCGPARTTV